VTPRGRNEDGTGRTHDRAVTSRSRRPAVHLHVGEPKSGTTFVQHVLWSNRDLLARQGVLLPGLHPQEHYRAQLDLRRVEPAPDDPTGSWVGEWDLLAKQALQADRAAVISSELLAAATPEQIAHARQTLDGADVHVVLSVRDFVSLLPAEWQETVKHRNTSTWDEWVRVIRDSDPSGPRGRRRRRARWFWRVHDTMAVLARWGEGIPAERVHVVTLPPPGSPRELLWARFASVLGVDASGADLGGARPNSSLGLAEAEMLRRLNAELGPAGPDSVGAYFYGVEVKERLAHDYLSRRPAMARPQLPADVREWAVQRSLSVVEALRASGYDVVGDLEELLPPRRDAAAATSAAASEPAAEDVLAAAVGALATVLRNQYRPAGGAADEPWGRGAGARAPLRARVKRAVRELSSRYPAVGRARVVAWRLLQRSRAGRR